MKVVYELKPGTPLTDEQRSELRALKGRPIDFSDIPELPPDAFKNAVRGKLTARSSRRSACVWTRTCSRG